MSRDYQIVLLSGEDTKSMEDLQVILDFLGEPSLHVNPSDGLKALPAADKILAVIVDHTLPEAAWSPIIEDLIEQATHRLGHSSRFHSPRTPGFQGQEQTGFPIHRAWNQVEEFGVHIEDRG